MYTCSEPEVFIYLTGKSMNNFLSYCCGLIDARIRASIKDLPVYRLSKIPIIYMRVAGGWVKIG